MAVYLVAYGPFMELIIWLFVCVLLVGHCFDWCSPVVCAPDRIKTRQAVGVYRAWIYQGGVSPVTTAQNKKTLPSPTDSVRCVTPPTRLRVIGTPFSRNAINDHIRSVRADAKLDRPTNSFGN